MDTFLLATVPCLVDTHGFIGTATQWIVALMDAIGIWGVALGVTLETVFPFLPSEVFLPLAGFTAATGKLEIVAAIVWATIGSVVGSWVLYALARWIGLDRLRIIADKIPGMSSHDIDIADRWFIKYDTWAVLIARCVPCVRSIISIPAGFGKMPLLSFTIWTAIGSAIWNTALMYAGYALGAQWCQLLGFLKAFQWIVLTILLVLIVLLFYWWYKRIKSTNRKKQKNKVQKCDGIVEPSAVSPVNTDLLKDGNTNDSTVSSPLQCNLIDGKNNSVD